ACDPVVSNASYKLANARLTYRTADESWNIALEATNLTDKLYYINKFYAGSYVAAMPGAPRAWALSVRRRF
ncbi:MAG: TonB-dependent receptor, partial [Pseudomonadota bacterium]